MDFNSLVAGARQTLEMPAGGENEEHGELLSLVKKLKHDGADCLTGYEDAMEKADDIYRAFRVPDEDDKKAAEKNEPIKIIYPITYAQIQTTLASLMAMFNRNPFFELEGRGPDFFRPSKLMELELQYQLEQSNWVLYLYQWFLDMLRYGFGKINTTYEIRASYIRQKRIISLLGLSIPMGETDQKVIGYEGAQFCMEDPYLINFDPTVSIGEIQKAQYVFYQETMSRNELKLKAEDGYYYNVEDIPKSPFNSSDVTTGRAGGNKRSRPRRNSVWAKSPIEGGDDVVIDHCYVKLVPADYSLSPLQSMQIWCISMANEAKIIRAEPSRFEHGMFPTSAIEYSPDIHSVLNPGMADTIDGLQETMQWLINSHIASVRKVVKDKIFVAEDAVNVGDLENNRTYIRVKKEYARLGIDKFFKQAPIVDVTQAHMQDAMSIYQHLQRVTGVNDNSMGMQLPTKRSATETTFMQRLGGDRMKLLAQLMFVQGFRPLGQQMIQNTQQFMSSSRFMKVSASTAISMGLPPQIMQNGFLGVSPDMIQGMFNIVMLDATTPLDKASEAGALKELLMGAMQVPQLIQLLGLNIPQIVTQILKLSGSTNTSDYMNPPPPDSPEKAMAILGMLQSNQRPVQASVQPEEQVQSQVDKGNLVAMPMSDPRSIGGMLGGGPNGGTNGGTY